MTPPPPTLLWTGSAHNFRPPVLAAAGAAAVHLVCALLSGEWWLLLVGLATVLVIALVAAPTCSVRVSVSQAGIRWRAPLRGSVTVAAEDLRAVELVQVEPRDFGGYGIRRWPGRGRGIIIRRGPGIALVYGDARMTITVDDAATGVALAGHLFGAGRAGGL